MGFHRGSASKAGKHFLHRGPGSYLALPLSSDPVGEDE